MPTLLQAIGEVLRSELVERGPIVLEETKPESRCERQGCQLTFRSNDRLFPLLRLMSMLGKAFLFAWELPQNVLGMLLFAASRLCDGVSRADRKALDRLLRRLSRGLG